MIRQVKYSWFSDIFLKFPRIIEWSFSRCKRIDCIMTDCSLDEPWTADAFLSAVSVVVGGGGVVVMCITNIIILLMTILMKLFQCPFKVIHSHSWHCACCEICLCCCSWIYHSGRFIRWSLGLWHYFISWGWGWELFSLLFYLLYYSQLEFILEVKRKYN